MYANTDEVGFTVHFVGYDGRDYSNRFPDLDSAKAEAESYSEHGCHCISIVDDNGNDYSF